MKNILRNVLLQSFQTFSINEGEMQLLIWKSY